MIVLYFRSCSFLSVYSLPPSLFATTLRSPTLCAAVVVVVIAASVAVTFQVVNLSHVKV